MLLSGMPWTLNTSVFSSPSSGITDDSYSYTNTTAVVVDGATALDESIRVDGVPAPAWLATEFSMRTARRLASDPYDSVTVFKDVIAELRARWESLGGNPLTGPLGAFACAYVRDDDLMFSTVGDCVVVVRYVDDSVEVSRDTSVPVLDSKVVTAMVEIATSKGISVRDARQHVTDMLRFNRTLRNRKNGYSALDLADDRWTRTGCYFGSTCHRVKDFLVMTDGFWDCVEYGLVSVDELVAVVSEGKADELAASLLELTNSDPAWDAYPRLKDIDDMTVLYATLEQQ